MFHVCLNEIYSSLLIVWRGFACFANQSIDDDLEKTTVDIRVLQADDILAKIFFDVITDAHAHYELQISDTRVSSVDTSDSFERRFFGIFGIL